MRTLAICHASKTMLRTAALRAAHHILDKPPIFEDPIAIALVPASAQAMVASLDADLAMLRAAFAVRSRFAEDRLARAAARNVSQYVMIGPGLDTFPWRQPDYAVKMRLFSADHPETLAWTRAYFQGRRLSEPPNLTFLPVDLEECRLGERLVQSGFDPGAPAFLSALGVTQYVSRAAIDSTLVFAASLAAGSEIVFSFVLPADELNGEDACLALRAAERAASLGEPWKTRLRPSDIVRQLEVLGFSEVFHLTEKAAHDRYFVGRQDDLKTPRFEQTICAIV